jgi:hypothetical protein
MLHYICLSVSQGVNRISWLQAVLTAFLCVITCNAVTPGGAAILFIELFNTELIPYPFCLTSYAVQRNDLDAVPVMTAVTRRLDFWSYALVRIPTRNWVF